MERIEISALIARKIIEALYGKISYDSDESFDRGTWYFSSCDFDSYSIEEREDILQYLDTETVKDELQNRYEAYWWSSNRFDISDTELDEIVMWAKNGFITCFNH
jgi:hypothetical protein